MAELNAFTKEMSDKHRGCYQIMKYLSDKLDIVPNYDIKTVVLHHHTTCSDITDGYVDCVFGMFRGLRQAYETAELLSYLSNVNIFGKLENLSYFTRDCERLINRLCSVSVNDSWDTFIRKV